MPAFRGGFSVLSSDEFPIGCEEDGEQYEAVRRCAIGNPAEAEFEIRHFQPRTLFLFFNRHAGRRIVVAAHALGVSRSYTPAVGKVPGDTESVLLHFHGKRPTLTTMGVYGRGRLENYRACRFRCARVSDSTFGRSVALFLKAGYPLPRRERAKI